MDLMYALIVDAQDVMTAFVHVDDAEVLLPPQRGSFASSQAFDEQRCEYHYMFSKEW